VRTRVYPKHKLSGVEWLGEVPEHWEIKKLKYSCQFLTQKTENRQNPIALENIESWTGRFIETESEFEGEGVAFKQNDILFGKLRPYLAKVLLAEKNGEAVGDFFVLHPLDLIEANYAAYTLRSKDYINIIDGSTFGSKMPRASWDFMGSLPIPLPPLPEQQSIASFLDRETSRIDTLIGKKQRLIELLKEKRTALISRAVTKGLNPEAKMKPSGVEWLGEVPEHWEVKYLKHVSLLFGRIGFRGYTTDDLVDEMEGAITLSPSNMANGELNLEKCTYISWDKYHESPEIKVSPEDILIVKTGSIGKIAYVREVFHPMTVNPQIAIFKNLSCNSRFLYYYISAPYIQDQISISNTGSTIPTMTQQTIMGYAIPIPPLSEQKAIAAFLDHETAQIDKFVSKVEEAILKLKEYRTAIISAAVTGKIDVREVA
jgi:type I restriction enzyme S subunit